MIRPLALAALLLALAAPALAQEAAALKVSGSNFELLSGDGPALMSKDLVGARFEMSLEGGPAQLLRIDAVTPAAERPSVLLHAFSLQDPRTGAWTPLCDPDVTGRRAGFPIAGRWDARGHFVKDPKAWFVACTSGAQGKCILWGYDPWGVGPHGEDLAPYYEACTHMVRADYDGRGAGNTRNGTPINVFDDLGIQIRDASPGPAFAFEAGWAPGGAVCVAKTRYRVLLPLSVLLDSSPRLGGTCDVESARQRGALIYNESR